MTRVLGKREQRLLTILRNHKPHFFFAITGRMVEGFTIITLTAKLSERLKHSMHTERYVRKLLTGLRRKGFVENFYDALKTEVWSAI